MLREAATETIGAVAQNLDVFVETVVYTPILRALFQKSCSMANSAEPFIALAGARVVLALVSQMEAHLLKESAPLWLNAAVRIVSRNTSQKSKSKASLLAESVAILCHVFGVYCTRAEISAPAPMTVALHSSLVAEHWKVRLAAIETLNIVACLPNAGKLLECSEGRLVMTERKKHRFGIEKSNNQMAQQSAVAVRQGAESAVAASGSGEPVEQVANEDATAAAAKNSATNPHSTATNAVSERGD